MSVLVITTGGTIGAMPYPDPKVPPVFSEMPKAGTDFVRDALARDFADMPSRHVALEPRDSKLIDAAYRDTIAKIIEDAPEKDILITHGTDTLLESAAYFFEKKPAGKIIILTGAMIPLSNGSESDGYRNLRFALEKLAEGKLTPGVSVVLSDFVDSAKREGWAPRLYQFNPGKYEKYYDPQDGRYSRIRAAGGMQV